MSTQGTAVAPIVPGSSTTAGVTGSVWETMSIPPDFTHIPGAGVAAGTPGPDRETMPTPSDCKRVPGNGDDAGGPFFVRFHVDDGILVEVRFFQDERRMRRAIRLPRVDPLHAAKFDYVFDEYAVVDLFLQLEWRSSPRFWDLVASSLEHAHNQTSFQDAVVSEHGRSAVTHVRVDAGAG